MSPAPRRGHHELDEAILRNEPGTQARIPGSRGAFGRGDSLSAFSVLGCLISHLALARVLTSTLESPAVSWIFPPPLEVPPPPRGSSLSLGLCPGPGSLALLP